MYISLLSSTYINKESTQDGAGMNIKIDGVHEAMLKEILKKWRMKSEQYFSEKSKRIIQ